MPNSPSKVSPNTKAKPLKITPPKSQQIHQWRLSFLGLNSARLEQARSLMLDRQTRVLDVLSHIIALKQPSTARFY